MASSFRGNTFTESRCFVPGTVLAFKHIDGRNTVQGSLYTDCSGSAASAKLEPVAFLVVKEDGSVKLLPVAPPPATTVDRVIETVPEVVDKVTGFIEEQQEKKAQKKAEADFAE